MRPRNYRARTVKVIECKPKPIVVSRAPVSRDFLKYIKVVRAWARYRHNINLEDFEMLCYLYSEQIFDSLKFEQYGQAFSFNRKRLNQMVEKDLISVFRKAEPHRRAMYELSLKGKLLMGSIYDMLLGLKPIPKISDLKPKINRPHHFAKRQFDRVIDRANKKF